MLHQISVPSKRGAHGMQLDKAVMAIPVHTAKHVTPQHSSTLHIVISRYIRVIPWRFSVGKLISAWDIPGFWRDLGFVGEFVARNELLRTQCYIRCIAFSLGFRTKVSVPSTESYAAK